MFEGGGGGGQVFMFEGGWGGVLWGPGIHV